MTERNSVFSPRQQALLALGLVLFFLSVYFLRSIYIPILVSYFLAFALNPVISAAEKRGFGRAGPIVVLLVLVFAGLLALAVMTLPRVVVQVSDLFSRLPAIIEMLATRFAPLSLQYFGFDIFSHWTEIVRGLVPVISSMPAAELLGGALSGGVRIFGTFLTLIMIPILSFYFLKDYHEINRALLLTVPRRYLGDVEEIFLRLSKVMGALIRGQFLICTILAIFYSIALNAVGSDMALLLGLISGFLNLVPVVGPLVSMILALVLSMLGGAALTQCMAIVGVYLVANLLEGTVLTPKIVGKQVGVSPLLIILALLAGGELLGFLGILLALPVLATVKVLGGYFAERYYASSFYLGMR